MKKQKSFKIRYSVKPWGKPPREPSKRVVKGIRVTKSSFGYTDRLFLVSMIYEENRLDSILMADTETGLNLTQSIIDIVREALDHYQEKHLQQKPEVK